MSSPSAWSFADLLRDDIDCWVSRCRQEARERGQHVVGSVFRGRLAGAAGITIKQLDRYCNGDSMPPPERLKIICQEIGTVRAVKHLAREAGVGVYDKVAVTDATPLDQVRQVALVMRDVGKAAKDAIDADRDHDGMISPAEYRIVAKEIREAIDDLEHLEGMLVAKMEEALRR